MFRTLYHLCRERSGLLRDLSGSAFFLFATFLSAVSAWQQPSLLAGLYAVHNGLLAFFYTRRRPAKNHDRTGLWLGLIAALLPMASTTGRVEGYLLLPALAGYALILWSLLTLGPRFGIAPADRGLTSRGPYQWVRHPMYLGELLLRAALVLRAPSWLPALFLTLVLALIQCWRILREEERIAGYASYRRTVRWRLIPGVW